MGKGSQRRPTQISRQEYILRWDYALGKISRAKFDRQFSLLQKKGLITRNGQPISNHQQ